MSTLALGVLHYDSEYRAMAQRPVALRNLRHALDWLVKAHITASDVPSRNVLVGQVRGGPGAVLAAAGCVAD